jgi:hypothetical protein
MTEQLKLIQERLQNAPSLLISKNVSAGLDGFIDSIVKVVNYKEDGGPVFFNTIEEFGTYISGKKGSGFSLETEELFQRLGGNMPILANAMAQMGAKVDCVGALGLPVVAPAFAAMHPNCNLYSFANPGFTTALEFTDGKMMLAQMTELNHADWNTVKSSIGLDKLHEIFIKSDLVCLVNWSELTHSNAIWKGLQEEVFGLKKDPKPVRFFFDLSDCSKSSPAALRSALDLIRKFKKYGSVTLSLNKNEAQILYKTFISQIISAELQSIGQHLFNELHLDFLIIHASKMSLAWDEQGVYSNVPDFISEPFMLTGAGDNFNAGYCMAQLLDLDVESSLILANLVSNIYIKSAKSPDLPALNTHISELLIATL